MSFLRTISDSREKLCSRHLELFYLSTSGLFVQATNVCLPFSMIFTFGAVYDACCKNAWAEGNLPQDSAYADQSGLWPH